MREWFKAAVGLLFVIAIYFIFTDAVDFSSRQAITLVVLIVIAIGYVNYRDVATIQKVGDAAKSNVSWQFLPYRLRVDPKWWEILSDFKLIATEDEWDQIKLAMYGAVPYGFSFTVLQQSKDNQLIFRPDERGQFVSEVDFSYEVSSIEFEHAPKHLKVFMEWRGDGYDLGIIVPEAWWNIVKADCPKPLEQDSGERWYEAKLTLARLSRAEFSWYWQPQCGANDQDDEYGERYEEWRNKVTSRRDNFRANLGWIEDEYCLAHRYFEVQHKQI